MARRHARRQIEEKRSDFGDNRETAVGPAHPVQILLARLLDDGEPCAQSRLEEVDRCGDHFGHDARPLAAAENQEA